MESGRIRTLCCLSLLLAVDECPAQDWSVAIDAQPPASAQVGDVIGCEALIAVDAGADDLAVNDVNSGAETTGIGAIQFAVTQQTVTAGSTLKDAVTGLLVAPPGSAGVGFQVAVDATLGATLQIKTAKTNAIVVLEGVAAALSGAPPRVRRGDSIEYDLAPVDTSDTQAQITVPHAGFAAPAGTTFSSRTDGSAMLAGGAATQFSLVVSVADSATDGTTITMTPAGVTYGMSDISLPARAIPIAPASVTSVVVVPIFASGFESAP